MRRTLVGCVLLLAVYVGLSFANDPHGYLGTDTGGKVATLRAMQQHGGLDPDVGYWATRWDPTGDLHPLFYTAHVDGKWVNVTTIPMLYAAEPLYRLGGYRLSLLLPMLGSVAAALAARALARRLGGRGWLAFWVVGLLSPLAVYALDFWEHSLGVALMAWAMVLLVDVAEGRAGWRAAIAAGLLFGSAATLRTEAFVYAAVATGAVCFALLIRRRRLVAPALVGLAVVAPMLLPLAGNFALERATVGGSIRSVRTSGRVAGAGSGATVRLREGLVTGVGFQPEVSWTSSVVGGGALLLLVFAVRRAARGRERGPAVVAGLGAAGLYAVRFSQGLGFVPGMTATSPVAGAGLAEGWAAAPRRLLVLIALAALPVVWAFQFLGGAYAQWGGRYVLMSGFLLTVVGATVLERAPRAAAVMVLGLAAAITAFGLVWLSSRSHDVARAESVLYQRPEAVLVSRIGHLAREGGAFYRFGGRPWLTAVTDDEERAAVEVVRRSGARDFAVVDDARRRADSFGGFSPRRVSYLDFLGVRLRITTYDADTSSRGG